MSRTAMLAALIEVSLFANAGTASAWISLNGVKYNGIKYNGAASSGVTLLAIEIPADQE